MTSPLTFVPLGGSSEIGMNLNVYGHAGKWMIVDCGVGFEHSAPGRTDVVMADPSFVANQVDHIAGLVVTHIHQDHLGGIPYLWPRLRCPIHLTPFAAHVLRPRLREMGLEERVKLIEHRAGSRFDVGPFDVTYVGLTHSTVEMCGLAIRTPAAKVFHTGDFKLDPDPVAGAVSDLDAVAAFGDEGVDVCVSDSTNATHGGHSRSEGSVHARLREVLAGREGRIAVGLFSSNVARIGELLKMAAELERHPCIVGRSMKTMLRAAQGAGYLRDVPDTVDEREAAWLPRDRVLYLCTGTQGEPGAALPRVAADAHPWVMLDEGDTVVFSSKVIPGNEEPIHWMHRAFAARKIHVVHEEEDPAIHASGHPCRDELAELYAALRPTTVIPVHGTPRHLTAHADWARTLGMAAHEVRNGHVVHLGPGAVRGVGNVETGRIPKDAIVAPKPWERRG